MIEVAKSTGEIPQCIRERPDLSQFILPYYKAFQTLSSSRTFTSAGLASISYPPIVCWLDENKITDLDEREDYIYLIQAMDNAYLELNTQKRGS